MPELIFDSFAYGGEAVGRLPDGRVCFVRGGIPGERAEVEIVTGKRSFARGRLLKVLNAVPERQVPECPLFAAPGAGGQCCPGCSYQQVSPQLELEAKSRQLCGFLRRFRPGDEVEVAAPFDSDRRYLRRNKLTLSGPVGGYRGEDNRTLIRVDRCPLAVPEINQELESFRRRQTRFPARLTWRWTPRNGVREISAGGWLTEELAEFGDFRVAASGFFQTNTFVAAELVRRVVALVAASGCGRLVELFCGVGLFSIAAAERISGLRCSGVELEAAAVAAAEVNAESHGVADRCRFRAGDAAAGVGRMLRESPAAETVLLLDPPRGGVTASLIAAASAARPRMIVYISCAPDTLARDLEGFAAAGYRLETVAMFNMFPATAHFETLAVLRAG